MIKMLKMIMLIKIPHKRTQRNRRRQIKMAQKGALVEHKAVGPQQPLHPKYRTILTSCCSI